MAKADWMFFGCFGDGAGLYICCCGYAVPVIAGLLFCAFMYFNETFLTKRYV